MRSSQTPNGNNPAAHIGDKAAFADRYLGHAAVNTVLPPALFAAIGNVSPPTIKAIAHFFGPHMPKFFPSVNLGIAGLITGIETAVRSCTGSLEKTDDKVHVPMASLSRQQAILLITLGWALQTTNGILQEYDPESEAHTGINYMLAKDALLAVASQLAMTAVGDRLIRSLTTDEGWGYRGAQVVGNVASGACSSISNGLSYLFASKADTSHDANYGTMSGNTNIV